MKRLVLGLLAAVVLLLGAAPAATAGPLDCAGAPVPEVPGRGITGFFQSQPDPLPAPGDPFAEHPTTTIYQQYGFAGIRWNVYDLGCGPDIARDPDAVTGTAFANWILLLPKAAIAATGATLDAAFSPDFLGVFDPFVTRVVVGLRGGLWDQWALLVVAAMGLSIVLLARRQQISQTAAAIGGAVLIMIAVTVVFQWPLVAGHAADQSVTAVLGGVSAGLNGKDPAKATNAGDEATAGMHDALLYQVWLAGTLGSADSDVAKKYGPTIFDSTALTWAEAAALRRDPEAGKRIIEAKQQKFKDTAELIKAADPDAYNYLTGRRSDSRVGYALLAGFATLCSVAFLFVAALLVLGALLIVRFGVMLFPAFATLGIHPRCRHLVTGIGGTVVAALINAAVFGIGALVFILGLGVALTAALPPWSRVLAVLVLTLVFWFGLRPFRHLTQMPTGAGAFRDAVAGPGRAWAAARRVGVKVAGAVVTGGTAGAVAGSVIADDAKPEPQARVEAQPDPYPVIVYPPAPDPQPQPAQAVIEGHVINPPQPALPDRPRPLEVEGRPALPELPPARMEATEPAYRVDWDAPELVRETP